MRLQAFRTAWKEAAWVFGLSRLVILVAAYISIVLFPVFGDREADCAHSFQACLMGWYHQDARAYVRIAHEGYSFQPDTAFFPLWPLLVKLGGQVLGNTFPMSFYIAGLLLANLFFYLALVLLHRLLSRDFEPTTVRRALFYLAFYPYAMFFFAGYTESLFLLLCVAVFLCILRGRVLDWWLAGILGFLAVLTRSSGIALVIPFLTVYTGRFWLSAERAEYSLVQKFNALLPVVLIPSGILAYMLYLGLTTGQPFVFSTQEAIFWNRHLALPGSAYGPAIGALFTHSPFTETVLRNLLDIGFSLLPLVALLAGWKIISPHYRLFALALAFFAISFPTGSGETLASQPRYMMVIFPAIAVLAYWGKRPWFDRFIVACFPALLAVNVVLFVTHHWVA